MVVSTESTGPTKSKKKRPAGSKSRRSTKQEAYLYDQPRSCVTENRQVVNEHDHLYDVVKPRGLVEDSTYQNVTSAAVYQNMDDM